MLELFEYATGESPTGLTLRTFSSIWKVHGSSIATLSYGLKISGQRLLQIFHIDDATQVRDVVVDGAQIECDKVPIIHQNSSKRGAFLCVCVGRLRHEDLVPDQMFFLVVTERTPNNRMKKKTPSDTKDFERSRLGKEACRLLDLLKPASSHPVKRESDRVAMICPRCLFVAVPRGAKSRVWRSGLGNALPRSGGLQHRGLRRISARLLHERPRTNQSKLGQKCQDSELYRVCFR